MRQWMPEANSCTTDYMDVQLRSRAKFLNYDQGLKEDWVVTDSCAFRGRYGMNRFGQCCLLARRLIEAGVRFVTINTFLTVFGEITWDIHGSKPFTSIEGMKNKVCPMYDKAYAALITELEERGMLEKTLVCKPCGIRPLPRSETLMNRWSSRYVLARARWLTLLPNEVGEKEMSKKKRCARGRSSLSLIHI